MALWDHARNEEVNFAAPRRVAAGPPFSNDNPRPNFDEIPSVELDCLRQLLAPELLHAAERRGRELDIGADQVLIQWGVIDEVAYLRRLAAHTGIAIENFTDVDRGDSPLGDDHILRAAEFGLVALRKDELTIWTVAPRRFTARTLCRFATTYRHLTGGVRLTSTASLQQFLTQQAGPALAHAATRGLSEKYPEMSAAPAPTTSARWGHRLKRGCGVLALVALPPILAGNVWGSLLAVWFLAFIGLRLVGSLWPRRPIAELPRLPDHRLPVYTVIAALYREASSVAPLMQAINALDYPREKLNVILVVEPDDLRTRAVIARLGPMPHAQVLIAPAVAPQTKPKALNCALPFARGSYVAVYDAEDRPEPGQLRAALDTFRVHGENVACAQASLCIDNTTHSLLSRTFAAEYAGQFDGFLPGMAEMGLPLPLGGSSNHFRTATLREVGGWDAYNVTEDADLGFRLARFGYRSITFASTTFEEAPILFGSWLRQRSRWMKGWMQTWLVHMRNPLQLWRDAGATGFLTLNIIVGGNVLSALAYPVLLCAVLMYLLSGTFPDLPSWFLVDRPTPLHIVAISAGYLSTIAVGLLGLGRRGRLRDGWILALTPVYWVCLSIAAWRAVWQYVWNPYHWEKTEHGLANRPGLAAGLEPRQQQHALRDSA